MSRDGPGLLLRDILREDEQVLAAAQVIRSAAPDILVITRMDTDAGGQTLDAFANLLGGAFPNRFTRLGNEGRPTGLDLDRDGRLGEAEDAQGFGRYTGEAGLAVLSRAGLPLLLLEDHSARLWRDLPGALITTDTLPPDALDVQRLSSTSHWVLQAGPMHLLVHAATPPVFDGPEDRNGRRNHDEAMLWVHVLDGALGAPISGPFALIAQINADPIDGDSRPEAIRALLGHPRLQDPAPTSAEAVDEQTPGHLGDPARDTANWDEPVPGNLRASYILPASDLEVVDAGVIWPAPGSVAADASHHGLVWVDVRLPEP
ncbi:endonuclease/exonuclease/phosphatase family protein [Roseobacteraceae bacterium S113]